ncbi:hypothetical protein BDN67DRAFT_913939, partial [Paxillus ammoniavirescens]
MCQPVASIVGLTTTSSTGESIRHLSFVDDPDYLINATVLVELRDLIHETPSLFLDEIGDWLAIYHD